MGIRDNPQAQTGQQSVDEQHLEAEMVAAEPVGRFQLEDVAQDRTQHRHQRHPAVAHLPTGEHAKTEETEQGSVGKSRNVEQRIDERLVVEGAERYHHQQVEQRKSHMHPAASR